MNISNAASKAWNGSKKICRMDAATSRRIIITLTNTPDCCLIQVEGMNKAPGKRWQPQARDLIANDWDVYGMN